MRNLAEHLKLLNTLFKDRRNNPLTTSYHFGRRIGKRGWFYALLRMLLVFFPLLSIPVQAMYGAGVGYTLLASVYLWFLPILSFYLFGVHRLDRQTLEELSLTRLSRNELVFGIFYWPVMTVFLVSLTAITTGLILLISDPDIVEDFAKWFSLCLVFWICWIVCAVAKTVRNYNLHLKARLLVHLGNYVYLAAGFFFTFVTALMWFSSHGWESIQWQVVVVLMIGMVIITLGILEDVFTGAAHRAFSLARGTFPTLASSERSLLNQFYGLAVGVFAILSFMLVIPLLARLMYSFHQHGTSFDAVLSYADRNFPPSSDEFVSQTASTIILRAIVGWDAFLFLMIVNVIAQALIGRWSAKKDPSIRIRPLTLRWEFWVFPVVLYSLVSMQSISMAFASSIIHFLSICFILFLFIKITGQYLYLFLLNSRSPLLHFAAVSIATFIFHFVMLGCAQYSNGPNEIFYDISQTGYGLVGLFTILCLAIMTGFGPAMYTRLKLAHFGEGIDDEVPIS